MTARPFDSGIYGMVLYACDVYDYCYKKDLILEVQTINVRPFKVGDIPDQVVYTNQYFVFRVPDNVFNDVNGDFVFMTAMLPVNQDYPTGRPLPSWIKFYSAGNYFAGYTSQKLDRLRI